MGSNFSALSGAGVSVEALLLYEVRRKDKFKHGYRI